jgi:hypothetical protein
LQVTAVLLLSLLIYPMKGLRSKKTKAEVATPKSALKKANSVMTTIPTIFVLFVFSLLYCHYPFLRLLGLLLQLEKLVFPQLKQYLEPGSFLVPQYAQKDPASVILLLLPLIFVYR